MGQDISAAMLQAAARPSRLPRARHPSSGCRSTPSSGRPRHRLSMSSFPGSESCSSATQCAPSPTWRRRPAREVGWRIPTWARRDESALFAAPFAAALAALGRDAGDLPDNEGPFSMPDVETITAGGSPQLPAGLTSAPRRTTWTCRSAVGSTPREPPLLLSTLALPASSLPTSTTGPDKRLRTRSSETLRAPRRHAGARSCPSGTVLITTANSVTGSA